MQRYPRSILLERFDRFISSSFFTDVNLRSKVYPRDLVCPINRLTVFQAPGRISFKEAMKGPFKECNIGDSFGPSWSTWWFKVEILMPTDKQWIGKEVHLIWDCNSEAMIFSEQGVPLQGLTGGERDRRVEFIMTDRYNPSSLTGDPTPRKVLLYIEMACNGMFGNGLNGDINPPDPNRTFRLSTAELRVFDREAYNLLVDFETVAEMARNLPETTPRSAQALVAANAMVNHCFTDDRSTWKKSHLIAEQFFSTKNSDSQHNVHAIGHCHIDVAWLWSYGETRRKAARSFSTQVRYMDRYPDYKFAQSQAQLYEWTKELYPELYEKIREKVEKGQFIPVGGTWVEMDGNLPSGEAFVRQFLYGQRLFKREFGKYCTEFWLPDTFGYSSQLPQIMRGCGIDCFLTQKLSWNLINKFPNSTFWWEGIDGSRVLTHFPPADTYNAQSTVKELLFNVQNFKDKERSNHSLYLFGNGDGGGGPTLDMLERNDRFRKDIDGLPRFTYSSPHEFFDTIKKDSENLLVWVGELYFELHRGTYTSQAENKYFNRRCEWLLHDLELFATLNCMNAKSQSLVSDKYPTASLDAMWKNVLLNQFHDVLPGSSIREAYDDSLALYRKVERTSTELCQKTITDFLSQHAQQQQHAESAHPTGNAIVVLNSMSWDRTEVAEVPITVQQPRQLSRNGFPLAIVSSPSLGYKVNNLSDNLPFKPVTIRQTDQKQYVLENQFVVVKLNQQDGTISSIYDKRCRREAIAQTNSKGGNRFVLFEDIPLFWDAWDVEVYHLEKELPLTDNTPAKCRVVESGPLRVSIEIDRAITSNSHLRQIITLSCTTPRIDFETEIYWAKQEAHKILKVEFPVTVRSVSASYDVQFGHIQRPTHFNTSWDIARFEVCGHKWSDLSEFGFGVSLLNNAKYGYSTLGNVMRLSLLRAPKAPDDLCDVGKVHRFKYSILTHAGTGPQEGGTIHEAYALNLPFVFAPVPPHFPSNADQFSLAQVVDSQGREMRNVVIETVKKAEDTGAIIIRVVELYGGHCTPTISLSGLGAGRVPRVSCCNMLEDSVERDLRTDGQACSFDIGPFEVVTLKIE